MWCSCVVGVGFPFVVVVVIVTVVVVVGVQIPHHQSHMKKTIETTIKRQKRHMYPETMRVTRTGNSKYV